METGIWGRFVSIYHYLDGVLGRESQLWDIINILPLKMVVEGRIHFVGRIKFVSRWE